MTMTGCKTAPKPEPRETQAIRCRIQEMYCDHSVWLEAVDVSQACDKDLESNAERKRNRFPERRLRGTDRAQGARQTLHCGPDVFFLPPFLYGCCVLYVFNSPFLTHLACSCWIKRKKGRAFSCDIKLFFVNDLQCIAALVNCNAEWCNISSVRVIFRRNWAT